ncbi:MAG: carotenoid oxygenase family protein [Cyanobacteria bacterium SBC]|nr:carotenoid oxygenase family protein [Cyanobacteria bacterium SBC]
MTKPTWSKAVTQIGREFDRTPLEIVSGSLPEGLRGTLYRNGPGRLERGNRRVGHWFDGDGAILAVQLTETGATAQYRFVQTSGYREEEQTGTLLFGNYGMTAPGAFWNRWTRALKNVANTSVLALNDRLLALWEAGKPHVLDLESLQTLEIENVKIPTYSAHPKRDVHAGEIFNFGCEFGLKSKLHLFVCDETGKIKRSKTHELERVSLIHDFVLAGDYLVFFVPPLDVPLMSILFGLTNFSDGTRWNSSQGTQVLVFDRNLNLVSRSEADPWFQWHFANGYTDESGKIVLDFVKYSDFTTNQRLKEIATGETQIAAEGYLSRVRIEPKSAKVLDTEILFDRSCEFPSVYPDRVGRNARLTYFSMHRQGVDTSRELYGSIGCYDAQTGKLHEADLGDRRYPMEPILAPDASNPEAAWVLTVVYDAEIDRSEVWVFDAQNLESEPVCRLALPEIIPMGFHGTWMRR